MNTRPTIFALSSGRGPAAVAVADDVFIGYNIFMTRLLEKGIEAVRGLSADRQDMAGELLLSLAKADVEYQLTPQQVEDVKLAIAEADRGEFANKREMAETWKKFGR